MHDRMRKKEEREEKEEKKHQLEERRSQKLEKKKSKKERDARIDELEAKHKKKKGGGGEFNMPIGTSLVTSLFNGIQLNVKHVHFRYEDDLFSKTRPFSLGFMIDEIDLGNADSHWQFHTANGMRFTRQKNK